MKAFLMHRDRDFDLQRPLPANSEDLIQDLELDTLLGAMAAGDQFLFQVARTAVLCGLDDPEPIAYRQRVLADCIEHPSVVREIYDTAIAAILGEKDIYFGLFRDSPEVVLNRSLRVLQVFVAILRRLRQIADDRAATFTSDGFTRFFAMIEAELDDAYFETLEDHLQYLRFRRGTLISAQLGSGNKGTSYILRKAREAGWTERLPGRGRSGYSFQIADRDDNGIRALGDLRGRGLNLVANALAQSTDHILSFFVMLRSELAFYIGCLNLRERLTAMNEPTCVPVPRQRGSRAFSAEGLYDVCLALRVDGQVVGNDVSADGKRLVMITGANQGGKSTFLRSVGLAQLMMQCGMVVPATAFRAAVRDGVFTHYKREEDAGMKSGKLDEELSRMSLIADQIRGGSMLLCNESFASTNEREGSELARQIVRALIEAGVGVFYVTHLFDLASGLHAEGSATSLFLRAERRGDGVRTFRLAEGEPLPTSFGEDLYRKIFGAPPGLRDEARGGAGAAARG